MANMLVFVMTMAILGGGYQVSALGVGPCACYQVVLHTLETCHKDSLIAVHSPKLTLNPDCTLVPEGCVSYGAFAEAQMECSITNEALTYSGLGKTDACKAVTFIPKEYKILMKYFQFDTACPVLVPNKVCAQPPMTNLNFIGFPFYLAALDFASTLGIVNSTLKGKHGRKQTCLKFAAEIKKDPSCPAIPFPNPRLFMPYLPVIPGLPMIDSNPALPTNDMSTLSTVSLPNTPTNSMPSLSAVALKKILTNSMPSPSTIGHPKVSTNSMPSPSTVGLPKVLTNAKSFNYWPPKSSN